MQVAAAPDLEPADPRRWAILFTRARLRKGWSYLRLATEVGTSEKVVINACATGRCYSSTALKLAVALDLTVFSFPPPPAVLTAQQAQHGR